MGEIVESIVTTGMIARSSIIDEPVQVAEPISLQEAKDHLRVVFDDEDSYISSLIVAARQMAEGHLNRTITQRSVEAAFPCWSELVLRKPPVIAVELIYYTDTNGDQIELADYSLQMRGPMAKIAFPFGSSAPSVARQDEAIVVRYTAGYPAGEVPRPIVQWMLLQIGTMYQQREGLAVGVSIASVPEEITKWMLQPYMVYE